MAPPPPQKHTQPQKKAGRGRGPGPGRGRGRGAGRAGRGPGRGARLPASNATPPFAASSAPPHVVHVCQAPALAPAQELVARIRAATDASLDARVREDALRAMRDLFEKEFSGAAVVGGGDRFARVHDAMLTLVNDPAPGVRAAAPGVLGAAACAVARFDAESIAAESFADDDAADTADAGCAFDDDDDARPPPPTRGSDVFFQWVTRAIAIALAKNDRGVVDGKDLQTKAFAMEAAGACIHATLARVDAENAAADAAADAAAAAASTRLSAIVYPKFPELARACQAALDDALTPWQLLPGLLKLLRIMMRRREWIFPPGDEARASTSFTNLADALLAWVMNDDAPTEVKNLVTAQLGGFDREWVANKTFAGTVLSHLCDDVCIRKRFVNNKFDILSCSWEEAEAMEKTIKAAAGCFRAIAKRNLASKILPKDTAVAMTTKLLALARAACWRKDETETWQACTCAGLLARACADAFPAEIFPPDLFVDAVAAEDMPTTESALDAVVAVLDAVAATANANDSWREHRDGFVRAVAAAFSYHGGAAARMRRSSDPRERDRARDAYFTLVTSDDATIRFTATREIGAALERTKQLSKSKSYAAAAVDDAAFYLDVLLASAAVESDSNQTQIRFDEETPPFETYVNMASTLARDYVDAVDVPALLVEKSVAAAAALVVRAPATSTDDSRRRRRAFRDLSVRCLKRRGDGRDFCDVDDVAARAALEATSNAAVSDASVLRDDGGGADAASTDASIFAEIIRCAETGSRDVREESARAIEALRAARLLSSSQLLDVVQLATTRVGDECVDVREAYASALPTAAAAATAAAGAAVVATASSDRPSWVTAIALAPQTLAFHPKQIATLMNFLTARPPARRGADREWVRRLTSACARVAPPPPTRESSSLTSRNSVAVSLLNAAAAGRAAAAEALAEEESSAKSPKKRARAKSERAERDAEAERKIAAEEAATAAATRAAVVRASDDAALWFATQECARHCVSARLRTHFGNAAETLALLERCLRAAAKPPPSAPEIMTSSWHLVEFTHGLERALYNAYEGTATTPPPGKTAASFFRANQRTCEEWLTRAREATLAASTACGHRAAAARDAILRVNRCVASQRRRCDVAAKRKLEAAELLPRLKREFKAAKAALNDAHKQHGIASAKLERAVGNAKTERKGGGGVTAKQQKQIDLLKVKLEEAKDRVREAHAGQQSAHAAREAAEQRLVDDERIARTAAANTFRATRAAANLLVDVHEGDLLRRVLYTGSHTTALAW